MKERDGSEAYLRIDEWQDRFEEQVHHPGNFHNVCRAEPLRIMLLEDIQYAPCGGERGVLGAVGKVYKERERLDTGTAEVEDAFEHEHCVSDLAWWSVGVLPRREEIQGRVTLVVVAENYLLASFVLRETFRTKQTNEGGI